MKYLIDTHVVIWFLEGNTNIPEKTRLIITGPDNEILVSIATFWEMAIKLSLGKLILPKELKEIIDDTKSLNISVLKINEEHVLKVLELPVIHKDPFDRIVISQAIVENLELISKDDLFDKYGITRIWN
jgi:PIN domain nuclease of toxin-antitoxin system